MSEDTQSEDTQTTGEAIGTLSGPMNLPDAVTRAEFDEHVRAHDALRKTMATLESAVSGSTDGWVAKRFRPPRTSNVEHRISLPRALQTGPIIVSADAYVRDWRREGSELVFVTSGPVSSLKMRKG